MDGTEILGAFLAESLVRGNRHAVDQNSDIHVVTPELENSTQMIFRDNLQPMIRGKKSLVLCGSLLTGIKVKKAMECVKWYGGTIVGVAAVFSILDEIGGIPVQSLFGKQDFPGYQSWDGAECPLCKSGQKIDALANCYATNGEYDKAISTFEKAAKKADNKLLSPYYYMQAGIIYESIDKPAQALKIYKLIKAKYPESNEGIEADKYIARLTSK